MIPPAKLHTHLPLGHFRSSVSFWANTKCSHARHLRLRCEWFAMCQHQTLDIVRLVRSTSCLRNEWLSFGLYNICLRMLGVWSKCLRGLHQCVLEYVFVACATWWHLILSISPIILCVAEVFCLARIIICKVVLLANEHCMIGEIVSSAAVDTLTIVHRKSIDLSTGSRNIFSNHLV